MSLFRSEEHLIAWPGYEPSAAEATMPVRDWAYALGANVFRRRMEPDYLDHVEEYFEDFFVRLAEFGRSGPFWRAEG